MAERIAINTGPLVTLARIDALDLLARLPYEFLCPQEVRRELDEGEAAGHPPIAPPCVRVVPLEQVPSPLIRPSLDLGEAAVIQLALEQGIDLVCIDEWRGRRAALATNNLKVVGVLGLLGKAKQLDLVPAVRPLIERAIREGVRYHPELIRRVLEELGE